MTDIEKFNQLLLLNKWIDFFMTTQSYHKVIINNPVTTYEYPKIIHITIMDRLSHFGSQKTYHK